VVNLADYSLPKLAQAKAPTGIESKQGLATDFLSPEAVATTKQSLTTPKQIEDTESSHRSQ
jgi:hypothetical protein